MYKRQSLSKSIRELASGFGVKFNCFITSDTNDTIIVNAGLFSKIFLDIFTFFMEQQNVGMKKMSDCYINLEESGDWWIIEVVKSNIRKQPEIKDVFMPLLSENNQVKINLFAVKQIITELGGNVIMPNNGRSKNQLCVIMSIPKLFQTGEYSMFLQDPIINLFDTLKLIYSTEYKYLESLMISN